MMRVFSHIALCGLLVATLGCGSGDDGSDKGAGSVFPRDKVADLIGTAPGSATGTSTTGSRQLEIRGFSVDVDDQNLLVAEEQVAVQDTQVGGVISANANDASGKVFAFTFSFVTLNQGLPREYELSVNPQDMDGSTAVINYSELVSDGTVPVAAQSVGNSQFRVEEFNANSAVGSFSMDLVLTGGDVRQLRNGTFRVSRQN